MNNMSSPHGVSLPNITALALGTALLLGGTYLSGCTTSGSSDTGGITITDPVVGAVPADSAALYMTIDNSGDDDAIVAASCDCSAKATLHTTTDNNGIAIMESTDEVDVPSGKSIVFKPGGLHIMLEDLSAPLEAGSHIEVEIDFEHAAPQTVDVPVVPLDELAKRVDES